MDDSLAVGFVDRVGCVADELHFFGQSQPGKGSFERLSVDKLHRDIGLFVDLADFEDLADRWMFDPSLRACFPLKPRDHLGIAAANELECDDAVEATIAGLEDHAHAAFAEHGHKLIPIPIFDGKLQIGLVSSGARVTSDGLMCAEVIGTWLLVWLHPEIRRSLVSHTFRSLPEKSPAEDARNIFLTVADNVDGCPTV
jgi:hypothetical protein